MSLKTVTEAWGKMATYPAVIISPPLEGLGIQNIEVEGLVLHST